MNPTEVFPQINPEDPTQITSYLYRQKHYQPDEISHLKFFEVDEIPVGLSPFEAANLELAGIYNTRNYTRRWMQENSIPLEGYLKAAGDPDPEEAAEVKKVWKEATNGEEGIAVLPNGIEFVPMYLKPSELQWIDVQKFDAIQQVRLLGLPSSVMLISLEGNSQTYANVEQDWISYVRFGLMSFLMPIQEELTSLAPIGVQIKFNTDALLRTDTLTRYQAHQIALGGKPWMVPEETRTIEDRDNTADILKQLNSTEGATNGI